MKKILIVAAHPDDETLGAGATIAKHIVNGDDVHVIILGEGITSRYNKRELANKDEVHSLKNDCVRALGVLGVKNVYFFDLPDNRFDTVPFLDIVKKIESKIHDIVPEEVYTHYGGDLNIDHTLTFEAVMVVCRPFNSSVKRVFCFEIPSSTEWNFHQKGSFTPNVFVNVEKTIDKKLSAMKEYKTEMRPYPHPRSIELAESLSKVRGSAAGFMAAEAFMLIIERVV